MHGEGRVSSAIRSFRSVSIVDRYDNARRVTLDRMGLGPVRRFFDDVAVPHMQRVVARGHF